MNAYEQHPFLLRAERGTPEYTAQLREVFGEIQQRPLTVNAASEWERLRDQHLLLLGEERTLHEQLLRPRFLIGGIEVGTYLLSLMVMIAVATVLTLTNLARPDLAALLGTTAGMVALNVIHRSQEQRRQDAARTVGVHLKQDETRHGWFGVHL